MAGDWATEQGPDEGVERVPTRRSLNAFAALTAILVLVLVGGAVLGGRLRPSPGSVPAATFAARYGVALPADPTALPQRSVPFGTAALGGSHAPKLRSETGTTVAPTDSPTANDVLAAYLLAWDVWAESCLALDPSPLEKAFASPELDRARAYVWQLRASGRALRLDVVHHVTVLELSKDTALLLDEMADHSIYLDPATRLPLPPGVQPTPVGTERVRCRLRRTESGWRVSELFWGR